MADVTVSFAADTSALDAAVAEIKGEVAGLKSPQITGVPGSPPMLFGASGQKYISDPATGRLLKYNAEATKDFAEAEKKLGDEMDEAGHKSSGFVGHMIAMGLAFKAVELSAKSLTAAVMEPIGLETAQAHFKALTGQTADYAKELKIADEVARATGEDVTKLYGPIEKLQDAGVKADGLKQALLNIDQAAKDTGVPVEHIADLFAKLKLNEATLPEMREAAHLSGQWKDQSLALVQNYENLAKTLPIIEKAQDAVTKATKQMAEDAERQTDRQMSLLEKLAGGEAKKAAAGGPSFAMPGFAPGAFAPLPPTDMAKKLEFGGMIGTMRVPQEAMAQYQRGLQEIASLEGTNAAIVRTQVKDQILGYQDVMRAGREKTEDDLRGLDRSATAQKEHDQLRLETAKIDTGQVLADNMIKANAQSKDFADHMNTAAGASEKLNASWKDALQHGAGIQGIMGVLSLGQLGQVPWAKQGGFQGGTANIFDQLKAALGIGGGPGGKAEIKEENSTKIESHLNDLVRVFTGGT